MNEGVGHALDQAIAFWRAPALLANARHRPLPDDVLDVVRIAAGDSNAAGQGAEATGADPAEVTEAAAFYLQQLLFAPGTDSYRVLGVNPGADDSRIKEHYRWLVRWLHPDRNPDEWEALYADRVNRAWQDLRTPAKRAAYDASRDDFGSFAPEVAPTAAATPTVGAPSGANLFPPTSASPSEPLLSARTARRLPYIVLGGFGAIAGALLTLMWYAQDLQPIRALPATAPAAAEVATAPPAPSPEPSPPPPVGAPSGANLPPQVAAALPPAPPVEPASTEIPISAPQPTAIPTPQAPKQSRAPVVAPAAVALRAAPAAAAEPAAGPIVEAAEPTPAPPTPITESQATPVLAAYTNAYTTGDLASLMQLFTQDARGPGGGRDSIAADYQSLFENTRKRRMVLQRQGWLAGPERATVLARFEARLVPAGGLIARTTQGDIRFDLAWEEGKLRIRGISHVED